MLNVELFIVKKPFAHGRERWGTRKSGRVHRVAERERREGEWLETVCHPSNIITLRSLDWLSCVFVHLHMTLLLFILP